MKQLHYFYLILGLLFILASCTKENTKIEVEEPKVDDFILCEDEDFKNDSTLDCGCNSETFYTIQESDSVVGILSQIDTTGGDYPQGFPYSYSILVNSDQGPNVYYVCNDFCISSSFDSTFQSSNKIKIKLSGDVKHTCVEPIISTTYVVRRVIIIKKMVKL